MCGVYGGVSLSLNTQLTLLTKFPHFRFCTWIAIIRILLQFIFTLLTVFYCGLLNIFQFPAVIVGRGVQWDSRSVLIPRKKIIQDSFDKKVNKGESCYKISNRHRKRKKRLYLMKQRSQTIDKWICMKTTNYIYTWVFEGFKPSKKWA